MTPIFVSFYSDSEKTKSYYRDCYLKLSKQLKIHDQSFIFKELPNNSYKHNCLSKPSFILEALTTLRQPIIWIDIDTVFCHPFLHFENCFEDIGFITANKNIYDPYSFLIYCNFTANAIAFLKEWKNKCKYAIDSGEADLDHDILRYEVLYKYNKPLNIKMIVEDNEDFINGKFTTACQSPIEFKRELFNEIGIKNETRNNPFYPENIKIVSV